MKIIAIILAAASLLLTSVASNADDPEIIYIELKGNAKFDVVYHRALSNSTGAVIGGLIGAGIQAGVESSKDADKREQVQPLLNQGNWQDHFIDTLNERLERKNFKAVWIEGAPEEPGLTLQLLPATYGIKIVDTNMMQVATFVEFDARIRNVKSKKEYKHGKANKQKFYIVNKSRRDFGEYANDKEALNGDLESALTKAAKRVANKIIYHKKVS